MGAWLSLAAACGSTVTKPNAVGLAGEGGGGFVDSGGAGGQGDVEQGGDENAPIGGDSGVVAVGGAGAAGDAQAGGAAGAPEPTCRAVLPVTYRDFNPYGAPSGHPDFEVSARGVKNQDGSTYMGWNDVGCGLVEPVLGADRKPRLFTGTPDAPGGVLLPNFVGRQQRVLTGPGCYTTPAGDCRVTCQAWQISVPTYSIQGVSTFERWFSTVSGVNVELAGELALTELVPGSGTRRFYSDAFFPLDGAGFGNSPGLAHNYSFTTEAHVKFTYLPGQQLTFKGDDDLWLFVNGKLAIDLGGQHQPLSVAVDLDAQATTLGILPGQVYDLDLFHAERQSPSSQFFLSTNIACFEPR